ncbi:MAG TPA: hypothetical protein VFQ53_34790 [Kofleriaceae bacterium]|nr:hypothetical protein [Kofleriaceae bacterium]
MKKQWLVMGTASLVLVGGACKKKEDSAGGSGKTVETGNKGEGGGAMPAEFASWNQPDAAKLWEGAHASRLTLRTSGTMSMAGDPAAIEIKGDKAKVWDGKTEHELGFVIDSPCSVAFKQTITEGSMKGGVSTHSKQFVVKGGQLLAGEGAAGYRKGKTAIVCTSGMDKLFTVDDKGCKKWKNVFDKWDSEPGECAWGTENGKDMLTLGKGDWATKVYADGDVLTSQQFDDFVKQGLHKKVGSYDEAKQAIGETVKANDPGEQAKAAGGTVGDTKTIVGLNATYASDKASLEGKPLEITAQYYSSSSSTANGVTSYAVSLVDSKDATKFTLSCYTKTDQGKGLKQFDKVTAKGTVKESFGKPSLEDCTLTPAK